MLASAGRSCSPSAASLQRPSLPSSAATYDRQAADLAKDAERAKALLAADLAEERDAVARRGRTGSREPSHFQYR